MKKMFLFFFLVSFFTCTQNSVAFIFEENFDNSIIELATPGNYEYISSGGWSGGAGKWYTESAQSYCGAGLSSVTGSLDSTRVNIRFLYFMGPDYFISDNKWAYPYRTTGNENDRQMLYQHSPAGGFMQAQIRQNTVSADNTYPDINFADLRGQWLCMEFESDLLTDTSRVYLTTEDGEFNETVILSAQHSSTNGLWDYVEGIGWYFVETPNSGPDAYFILDNIKVSDEGYIGPPSGFVDSGNIYVDCDFGSPPTGEDNGGVYTGDVGSLTLDVRNGEPLNYFDHVTGAECWQGSGGCARFYGSETGGGVYRGFLGPSGEGLDQLNLRYLKKWNGAWSGGEGAANLKGQYMTMGGSPFWTQEKRPAADFGPFFQMALSYDGTLHVIHGNGQDASTCSSAGYNCCPHTPGCTLGEGVELTGPFDFTSYDDEWISLEIELHSDGTKRLYIWTQDGVYNGEYMTMTGGVSGTPGITGFSGMYFHDSDADPGSYIMLDEVVVSDSPIGPPAGFVGPGPNYECSDGLDNDGDGQIDFPGDTGCISENDDDETDCGDLVCEGGEDCSSCPGDCISGTQQCCSGSVYEPSTQVCCFGSVYSGDCCSDGDCSGGEECQGYACTPIEISSCSAYQDSIFCEDFESPGVWNRSNRCETYRTDGCAYAERVWEGGERGHVHKTTLLHDGYKTSGGTCNYASLCDQSYLGFARGMDVGNPVYHRFCIKYGDSGNPYSWATDSSWPHEFKFPDISPTGDRIIVKHTRRTDSSGRIEVYVEPPGGGGYSFPPDNQMNSPYWGSDGSPGPSYYSDTWYCYEFMMYENGVNDELSIWINNDDENNPDFHYTGDLYYSEPNWDAGWGWGYRNHVAAGTEIVFSDDYVVSDRFIGSGQGSSFGCDKAVLVLNLDGDSLDSSGNGNDGALTGGSFMQGRFGQGLELTSSSEYLEVPESQGMVSNGFTAMAWFRANSFPGHAGIIGNYNYPLSSFESEIDWDIHYFGESTDSIQSSISSNSGDGNTQVLVSSPQEGVWYHLAVSYNGSRFVGYVNGTEVFNVPETLQLGNEHPFHISDPTGWGRSLNGIVDDVAVWNRSLTGQEIQELFSSGQPVSCQAAYHPADSSPRDCRIDSQEITDYIQAFYRDSTANHIHSVMDGIAKYYQGSYC